MTDECHPDVASPYLLITTAVRQAYRQTRPGSGGAGCPDRAVQRRHHRTAGGCRTARLTCGCSQYARYLYVLRLVPVLTLLVTHPPCPPSHHCCCRCWR